jgi:hypothetical protein
MKMNNQYNKTQNENNKTTTAKAEYCPRGRNVNVSVTFYFFTLIGIK